MLALIDVSATRMSHSELYGACKKTTIRAPFCVPTLAIPYGVLLSGPDLLLIQSIAIWLVLLTIGTLVVAYPMSRTYGMAVLYFTQKRFALTASQALPYLLVASQVPAALFWALMHDSDFVSWAEIETTPVILLTVAIPAALVATATWAIFLRLGGFKIGGPLDAQGQEGTAS